MKIVNRLPSYLQGKWRHVAVKAMDSSSRYPNFGKLVEFLEVAARELNDPVFGCTEEVLCETKCKQSNKTAKQGASFGTEATSEKVKGRSFDSTGAG